MNDLLDPPRNCHRLENAHRAAFIIDGQSYYRAIYESFQRAKHSIFIVGWDLHSDLRLVRQEHKAEAPVCLGELLNHKVAEQKDLHVYLLNWDFAMIYATEREFFPRYKLQWRSHRRIHFCLDGDHPVGGSQHQKIVVVDDAVAFAGGFDLSQWRWDTSAHQPEDERRVDPDGSSYPPFHDIQMAVDGPAAALLGELARERWTSAAGKAPTPGSNAASHDPWPPSIEPDLTAIKVAVARTRPAYGDREAVREVEQLYLDSIASARRSIYIENQYLSSHRVAEALERRLREPDGPEVVLVLPEKTGGWLEQHTMDVLRGRILNQLRGADQHDRLRAYYPRLAEDPHCSLMVHAKVMVIDDDFVRIGSSNLSNRSMGLDSECDLAIAAETDDTVHSVIARFRNRLLAEHLNADVASVSSAIENHASLIQAIEAHDSGARTLAPLSGEVPSEVDKWVPESALLDPEKPVEPDELFNHFVRPDQQPSAYRHLLKTSLLFAGVFILAALWRWTPMGAWLDLASVQATGEWIRGQPLSPLLVVSGYLIGGVIALPVTLLIIATVMVFGPWWGLMYALIGSQVSALAVFWAGRRLGRDTVRKFAGSMINRLSQRLSDAGMVSVITFRIVPVAPFSIINLVAGVSEIHWRDFVLGSFVGMLPGVVTIVLLSDRIAASLRAPNLFHLSILGLTIVVVGAGLWLLRRWVKRKQARQSDQQSD